MKAIRSEIQMRIELKFEGLDMKKPPQRDIEICLAAYLFLRPNANGGISKTVMNDVPSVPIGDFENTLSFPSEETSLGSGLPSHLPSGDVPCPSSPSHGFLHHTIGTLNNAM
jgi:hypothetical protein